MKIQAKHLALAVLVGLFLHPGTAGAACNDANGTNVTLGITGPGFVRTDSTGLVYTLTFNPTNVDTDGGTYNWTKPSGLHEEDEKDNVYTLEADSRPSSKPNDKIIKCEFTKDGWSSATECSASKTVTVYRIRYDYGGLYDDDQGLRAYAKWQIEPTMPDISATIFGVNGEGEAVFSTTVDIDSNGNLEFDDLAPQDNSGFFDGNTAINWKLILERNKEKSTNFCGTASLEKPSPFTHRWQHNALSQGRKISLSGMPMPDVAQHREGESDYRPENTYVDALNLDLRHDVTDIHVPVGSDHFALEVRRSLEQEVWDDLAPQMRPDKPFGPCWSSSICPNLQIVDRDVMPKNGPDEGDETTIMATDFNGQAYRFRFCHIIVDGEATNDYSWAEPLSSQSALSMRGVELGGGGGEPWVLSLPNGTRCFYEGSSSASASESRETASAITSTGYRFFRISRVEDRAGNWLEYDFSGSVSNGIVPSAIRASTGQEIAISSADGKRVDWVEDPRGNRIHYVYDRDPDNGQPKETLRRVERPDGGSTLYGYAGDHEVDSQDPMWPATYNHLMIAGIEDANGNRHVFDFERTRRYSFSTSKRAVGNKLYKYGNPHRLTGIERPDGSSVGFSDSGELGTHAVSIGGGGRFGFGLNAMPSSTVTDVNGETWTYRFSDPLETNPVSTDSGPVEESQIRLFEYRKLVVTAPGGGTETYRFGEVGDRVFNGLQPQAIVAQTNFSGRGASFAYGFAANGCYKPSSQTNALDGVKRFTYTANFGNQIESETDELGRATVYRFDAIGNRTNATVYDVDGSVLGETRMEYANADFPNFMTRKTVKRLPGTGEPGWVVDLVTGFEPGECGKVGRKTVDPDGLALTTIFGYDPNNNLVSVIDPNGNETVNVYDALNRLKQIKFYEGTVAGGGALKCFKEFWYDLRSNKTWERDENGNYAHFEYDGFNNLVKTVRIMAERADPADGLETHAATADDLVAVSEYNPDGTLRATIGPRGLRTEFRYDALRRLTASVVDPGGLAYTNSYAYSTNGNFCGGIALPPYKFVPTSVTDPRGFETETIYDALGRPVETRAELANGVMSKLSAMGYDAAGNLRFATNWVDETTCQVIETVYDGLGRPCKTVNPDQTETEAVYASTGLEWKSIDELGRVGETEYDAAGRPVLARSPQLADGSHAVARTGYDANGNPVWTMDANGNETATVYDHRNRPVQTVAPAVPDWGNGGALTHPAVATTYDSAGNATSVTDAEGNATTNFYDFANRLVVTVAPEVDVYGKGPMRPATTNEYDHGGNIRFTRDANGKTVEMQYDILGRLTNTVDAVGNTISFRYDANGNQTALIDGNGNATEFVYDGLNRKTHTRYPEVNGSRDEEIAGYDFLGNRTRRIDCNGKTAIYSYDARSRLDRVYYESGKERDYSYDLSGNLTNVLEYAADSLLITNACVSYAYDALNRVKTETSAGVTHTYKYDLNGNRTNAVYGVTGRVVDWTCDALNRIATIVEGSNATEYRYDLNGRPVWRRYPTGVVETRSFDPMGRLLAMATTNLASEAWFKMEYEYDAVGSARKMVQTSSGLSGATDAETYWSYDDRYRLTNETIYAESGTNEYRYGWDAADNRTAKASYVDGSLAQNITYANNALNQVVGWHDDIANKDVAYYYNHNGNRQSRVEKLSGVVTNVSLYAYDEDNRLTQAVAGLESESGPVVNAFKYDYRTRRYYRATSTETNLCVFDGGLSVQEYDVSSASYQISTSDSPTVEYIRGEGMGGGVGGMVYSIRNGQRIYSHANHRGDVIARTDDNRSLTSFALYEAYGTRPYEWSDGVTGDPDRQKANTKEEEKDLGLLNEGMRFRDLETGVFLTRDPIGYGDGPNVYCYVRANPIMAFDPLGLFIETDQSDDMEAYFDENGIEDYIYDEDRGGYTFGDDYSYDKDSLTSEILYGLISSSRTFSIADSATDNLKTHVAAREEIVNFAKTVDYKFGAGENEQFNPKLWEWSGNSWDLKSGVTPEQAIADMVTNPEAYTMACQSASKTTMMIGAGRATGQPVGGIYHDTRVKNDIWIPGDWGHINNDSYVHGQSVNGTQGENIIYLGGRENMAWGHTGNGSEYATVDSWQGTVNNWDKSDANSATISDLRTYPTAGLEFK